MTVFYLWLAWIAFNFFAICLVSVLPVKQICFTGFVIKVPVEYEDILTPNELLAVVEHEMAHKAKLHVWQAFLLRCLFLRPSPEMRRVWELQADDAVTNRLALASALRKISKHSFDMYRAERLENSA